jgi:hypothetical protein
MFYKPHVMKKSNKFPILGALYSIFKKKNTERQNSMKVKLLSFGSNFLYFFFYIFPSKKLLSKINYVI